MSVVVVLAALAVAYLLLVRRTFISSEEAHRLVGGGAALIDVRSPGEFAAGHIDGARNIPVGEIGARAAEVGPRETPVVVYCASGVRSARAASTLRSAGFTAVHNLGSASRW